jgi:hypothetical protein
VTSSAITRASGSDRANRSSLVTTKVAPSRQRFPQARPFAVATSQAVVDIDPVLGDTQPGETFPFGR